MVLTPCIHGTERFLTTPTLCGSQRYVRGQKANVGKNGMRNTLCSQVVDIRPIEEGGPTPADVFVDQMRLLQVDKRKEDGDTPGGLEEDNLFSTEFANGALSRRVFRTCSNALKRNRSYTPPHHSNIRHRGTSRPSQV